MISVSNEPITKLAEMALKKPEDFGYWGDEDMFVTWGFTGHDRTAMSKTLEEANFKAISEDLMTKYPDDFRIEHYRHWACGWVDRLVCRILIHKDKGFVEENITEAFAKAIECHIQLEDYPIFDENLYSEMETEEIFQCITDLPKYLLDMIDQNDSSWVDKIIHSLYENLNVEIVPDADIYPKDDEILMAVYIEQLWNTENIDLWEEFCERNHLEFPMKKHNPNQLNLFED